MSARKKRLTNSDATNILTESFLYRRFEMLMLNQFKWNNLPEGIEERHIERALFDEGRCLFFQDELNGWLCLPCCEAGTPNVYGDHVRWRAMGFNYYKEVKLKDAVLIENNKLRMASRIAVLYFVNQLYEIIRTRDTNIKTLKLPFVFTCDDKSVTTLKAIFEKIDQNEYAIFSDKSIKLQELLNVLQTGVQPFTAELSDVYHDVMNEALTYLGINNSNTDKRERLITDEANANNQFIDSCAEMFLEARKRACEEINEKFGLNISVELRVKREVKNETANVSELNATGQQSSNTGA